VPIFINLHINDGKELNQSFFELISWSWKRKSEEALPRDP
jgi:hypothetical protein